MGNTEVLVGKDVSSDLKEKLDYACIAINDHDGELDKLGSLSPALELPKVGDLINIIQHPDGATKKLALAEPVSGIDTAINKLWYKADTLGGSSGSPVFNQEWEVVALHHVATSYNAEGEKDDNNKGVLIGAIMEELRGQM